MKYVVYWCGPIHDGAKLVFSLEVALELINRIKGGWPLGGNCEFRLFELGKEIPLHRETVEELQSPKKTMKYILKK